jgi:hypothetical protein
MPKALCITGLVLAALLFFIFTLDLVTTFPFNRANIIMDLGFVVCTGLLGYLSWKTFREQV